MSSKSNLCRSTLSLLGLFIVGISSAEDSALEVFEQRIMPIFRSPDPSSCVQCHLASVDLKDYILPSHEDTFVSLRNQGLIDVEHPDRSKILKLIDMGDEDRDGMARRIHAKNRKREREAFAAWIAASCRDPELVSRNSAPSRSAGPSVDVAVIRHARKDRVLDSFVRNVWSQRMRCFPCHTPGEIDRGNPKHAKPLENYERLKAEYGGKMDLFRSTPEATLKTFLDAARKAARPNRYSLVDVQTPSDSLLLLKPTSKIPPKLADGGRAKPSSVDPVTHGGGLKMHKDDISYKSILAWIEDLGRLREEEYDGAGSLPPDHQYPTKHVLRIKGAPEDWPTMARVQLFVFLLPESADSEPLLIARTQGVVTPRRMINGVLMAVKSNRATDIQWDSGGVELPPGEYEIRVCVDHDGRLAKSPGLWLDHTEADFRKVIQAEWGEGFREAVIVSID